MTSPRDATHEAFDRQSTDPQAYLELARPVTIAAALTLELAPVERDYLRRLEEFVVWAGRYPVPRRSDTYATSERDGLLTFMSDDPTRGEHLFDRLAEHVGPSPRPTDD